MRDHGGAAVHPIKALITILVAVQIAACDGGSDNRPYLEFAGGGFIFNYRLATADYGFVARVVRDLPDAAVIEARFENPAGGEPIVLRQTVRPERRSYVFRTPPLEGVKSGRDYRVELRVLAASDGALLASYAKSYQSSYDQADLPAAPLAPGPGYHQPVTGGAPERMPEKN